MPELHKLTKATRKSYVQIAEDLCYPTKIVIQILEAETEEECERILATARHNKK